MKPINTNSNWNKNSIQFPRLINEIEAIGLTDEQHNNLCDSMDLEPEDIDELFDRAQREFDNIKRDVL